MHLLTRSGLTLVEIMVTLAIIAVLAAVAVPSLREFMMQQRLKSAAAELLADMQLARSTALSLASLGSSVNVNFRSNANSTCYSISVVTPGTNCDCTRATNICRFLGAAMPPPLRVVTIERSTGITVASPSQMNILSNGMTDDQPPIARTLTVNSSTGLTLDVIVGQTGFPRLCAPSGTNISGVPAC